MILYGRRWILLAACIVSWCVFPSDVYADDTIVFRHERQPDAFSWDQCMSVDYMPGLELAWSGQPTLSVAALQKLQAVLVTVPENLLHENSACLKTLARTTDGVFILTDVVAQELLKNNPLCLLSECHECLLTRLTRLGAMARTMFEREMVMRITDGYVNVGGGFAFQDLVLITQTLQKNPCANLTIHLVDPLHVAYIHAAHRHGISRIDMNQDVTHLFFEDWYSASDFARIRLTHELFHQMVRFIHHLYPHAHVTIRLYRFVEDLLRDCERNTVVLPQIVMSSDLGTSQEARTAFANLVRYALKVRPDALGMSLDKEKPTESAMIHVWANRAPSVG